MDTKPNERKEEKKNDNGIYLYFKNSYLDNKHNKGYTVPVLAKFSISTNHDSGKGTSCSINQRRTWQSRSVIF